MVKIIHAGDFHLDSPFGGLPPEKARQRRGEQRENIAALSELARESGADIILLSGDLFDSDNAFYETTTMLKEVFASIDAEIFISPGNHDYYFPGSPYRSVVWPTNVHVFTSGQIECVSLPNLNCRVYGAAFTAPNISYSILSGFKAAGDDMVNIMVLHGDLSDTESVYNPVLPGDIEESGLDYLALGHIHSFSGIQRRGKTDFAYCGCVEGRGFDELGEKGLICGTVEKGHTDLKFVPVCKRKYVEANLDCSALQSGNFSIPAEKNDIVRITLVGERDGEVKREDVEKIFAGKFYHVIIRDRTVPKRDVWEGIYEDSLRGIFLRSMREMYDAADDEMKKTILLGTRYGIASMENGEEPQL